MQNKQAWEPAFKKKKIRTKGENEIFCSFTAKSEFCVKKLELCEICDLWWKMVLEQNSNLQKSIIL